jgi:hypothetical protein
MATIGRALQQVKSQLDELGVWRASVADLA